MSERLPEIAAFLDALHATLHDGRLTPVASQSIERVFSALQTIAPAGSTAGRRLETCSFLPEAIRAVESSRADLAPLLDTFKSIEPRLDWGRRSGNATASASFAEGHANTMIVGPGGLEARDDVWIGVSLLAPDVRYPDHRHAPEEVYLVLSPGEFWQGDGDWFEPGVGGTFYNRPNILHAMRSGPVPLLALWCLWDEPAGLSDP